MDTAGQQVRLPGANAIMVWAPKVGGAHGLYDQSHWNKIAAKGFKVVRMPIYWTDLEPTRGVFDQTYLKNIDTAIGYAKAAGLYVVPVFDFNFNGTAHTPEWARTGDAAQSLIANGQAYVKMLAARWKDMPHVAMYDVMNETPANDGTIAAQRYNTLLSWVRAVAPEKIVLVKHGWASIDPRCGNFAGTLTHRANLVYDFHDYYASGTPWTNCSQSGDWAWDAFGAYNGDKQSLRNVVAVIKAAADSIGAPMIMGEVGNAPTQGRWHADKADVIRREYGTEGWMWLYGRGSGLHTMDTSGNWWPIVNHWVD